MDNDFAKEDFAKEIGVLSGNPQLNSGMLVAFAFLSLSKASKNRK